MGWGARRVAVKRREVGSDRGRGDPRQRRAHHPGGGRGRRVKKRIRSRCPCLALLICSLSLSLFLGPVIFQSTRRVDPKKRLKISYPEEVKKRKKKSIKGEKRKGSRKLNSFEACDYLKWKNIIL